MPRSSSSHALRWVLVGTVVLFGVVCLWLMMPSSFNADRAHIKASKTDACLAIDLELDFDKKLAVAHQKAPGPGDMCLTRPFRAELSDKELEGAREAVSDVLGAPVIGTLLRGEAWDGKVVIEGERGSTTKSATYSRRIPPAVAVLDALYQSLVAKAGPMPPGAASALAARGAAPAAAGPAGLPVAPPADAQQIVTESERDAVARSPGALLLSMWFKTGPGGEVDLAEPVRLSFASARTSLLYELRGGKVVFDRAGPASNPALMPATMSRCSSRDLRAKAKAAGMAEGPATVSYGVNDRGGNRGPGPVWQLVGGGKRVDIDGATCATLSTRRWGGG